MRLAEPIRSTSSRALELREQGKDDKAVYRVHNRLGEPCPQCGTPIARVDYEEHRSSSARHARPVAGCSRTAASRGSFASR